MIWINDKPQKAVRQVNKVEEENGMGRFVLNFEDQNISLREPGRIIEKMRFFLRATAIGVLLVLMFNLIDLWVTGVDVLQRAYNTLFFHNFFL